MIKRFLIFRMHVQAQDDLTEAASQLPLVIRERDTEYQFYRIVLYTRLLEVIIIIICLNNNKIFHDR